MNAIDTWKALKSPSDRSCDNCNYFKHSANALGWVGVPKGRTCAATNKRFPKCANQNHKFWEWDGKNE